MTPIERLPLVKRCNDRMIDASSEFFRRGVELPEQVYGAKYRVIVKAFHVQVDGLKGLVKVEKGFVNGELGLPEPRRRFKFSLSHCISYGGAVVRDSSVSKALASPAEFIGEKEKRIQAESEVKNGYKRSNA